MIDKKIVIDLDQTIAFKGQSDDYSQCTPDFKVRERLIEYRKLGFAICIFTARNMRKYDGNIGLINAVTLPVIIQWLTKHDIPFDEIIVGKPWCGESGFYVDDRAIRPDEFVKLSFKQIEKLLD